jgi:hypothetical protein
MAEPPAKLRPGRVWYWIASAVFLAGVAWAVVAFVLVIGQVDSFPRVPIPGTGTLTLQRGGYVVYYEEPGAPSGAVPTGHISVTPLAAPAAVGSITPYSGNLTYQFGSRGGSAVLSLQIARSGRFLIRATSPGAAPGSHLAFGRSIAPWIVAAVVPAILLTLAGIAGVIVVAIIRYSRARRPRVPQPLS